MIKRGLHYLIRNCYFILMYDLHKGFLIIFVPPHFKQSSATRSTDLPQLQYAPNSPFTCRLQFRCNLFFSKPTIAVDPKWCYAYWSWTETDMTFILAKDRGLTVDRNWYAPTEQYSRKNKKRIYYTNLNIFRPEVTITSCKSMYINTWECLYGCVA